MNRKDFKTLYSIDKIHPGFSIDCVMLCFYKKRIMVLLNQFKRSILWQLPGGFMLKEETADKAAERILNSRTGLRNIYLKQFHLFSDIHRANIGQNEHLTSAGFGGEWLFQRYISLGYYALVRYDEVELLPQDEESVKWFDIKKLPELYSDHNKIIEKALETIKVQLPILPIAHELLPEKFTLSEFRKIYEIILDKTFDRRNFQRKVITNGVVTQIGETKANSTYNPAELYAFSKSKEEVANEGIFIH